MLHHLLYITTSVFVLYSCANSKNAHTEIETVSEHEEGQTHVHHESEHQPLFENVSHDDSLFASIKRGYCYGTCPVYEMNIYNSGFVTYNGIRNLKLLGRYTATISKEQMIRFFDVVNETGYLQMEDEYDNPGISDLPETTTSVVVNGTRKQVRRRYGYPKSITVFEKEFDDLIESENWLYLGGGNDR